MPFALLTAFLAALAAGPPLADAPEALAAQAARPVRWQDLASFDSRRLRLSVGLRLRRLSLSGLGGDALGPSATAALEFDQHELALTLFALAGRGAQDATARTTGFGEAHLGLAYRFVPFAGRVRIGLGAGAQVGWERDWAWCVDDAARGPQCGLVSGGPSWSLLAGPLLHARLGDLSLIFGLELALRGRALPASLGGSALALQSSLEVGYGGLPW